VIFSLTKKCSAAGQTDDGLEPGEQSKPAHTAGPLQRLVRRHASLLTMQGEEHSNSYRKTQKSEAKKPIDYLVPSDSHPDKHYAQDHDGVLPKSRTT